MNVLALVPNPYDTAPGQRFRMEQWEPFLRAAGIHLRWAPFASERLASVLYRPGNLAQKTFMTIAAYSKRLRTMYKAGGFDAAYVFREAALIGPPVLERWLGRAIPFVYDFDDAVFLSYESPTNRVFGRLRFPSKTPTACRLAMHVMAGNGYLAEYARRFNDRVSIVPTTIDTEKYVPDPATQNRAGEPLVIGWSGSHSTVQHLRGISDVLARLAATQRFRLRVIGADDFSLSGVDLELLQWRSTTEVDDLRRIDIGLMPLPDDQWSRGKCGLKALQYMALGIPPVCSPVGVNAEIIADGENGFLVDTPEQWTARIVQLLESPELRERLGRAARRTVEHRYAGAIHARRVAGILRSIVGPPRS
jgi:glycosyltransferase involved in cell wall biosynthesis